MISCNLPSQGLPAFVAPAGNTSPTPDWAATLRAAVPTETPIPVNDFLTETPVATANEESTPVSENPAPPPLSESTPILYTTQAGDTLEAIAFRFGVTVDEIASPDPIPLQGFINPNQLLIIPDRLPNTTSTNKLLPDSEVIYTLSAVVGFDIVEYVNQSGGYLSTYSEYLGSVGQSTGAEIVAKIALENSINPRLLLALLEYQSGWVTRQPSNLYAEEYPFGFVEEDQEGLLHQLKLAVNQLSIGYYDWREGRMNEIQFADGASARLEPGLNAGTAALLNYFAQTHDSQNWLHAINPETGFPALYESMFGNPFIRANSVEPIFPPAIKQPHLELPFMINQMWSYTGGPHGAWEKDGSWAAVDFSPARTESGCVETSAYVTASAAGLVVRSGHGIVVVDLDGDGFEQTGWVIVYLHIATDERIPVGEWVETGDLLGHPSCEGGHATGTHVHMARKYNGEWMAADGAVPLVLTGWKVHAGTAPYKGTLTRDGETITASTVGAFHSRIVRDRYEGSQ
jgi:LysM repeat protein